jgi:hypothetical protein
MVTSYADREEVRRQHGFFKREVRDGFTTTSFLLNEEAHSILILKKNGVTLTVTTDYTFAEPKKITLTLTPSATDIFVIEYATQASDDQVDYGIRHAKEEIKARLGHRYSDSVFDDWDVETPGIITELATELAGYYVDKMVLKMNKIYGMERDINRRDIESVLKRVDKIRTGELVIEDLADDGSADLQVVGGDTLFYVDLPSIDDRVDESLIHDTEDEI